MTMNKNNIDNNIDNKSGKLTIKEVGITIITALLLSFVILYFFRPSVVEGKSMTNTLQDKDKLILINHPYANNSPKYKDVVVVERDDLSVRYIIKRVIGVEGDKITIKDNQLYINDALIDEDYIKEPMITENMEVIVPQGKVFCMGDNRNNSLDSRSVVIGLVDIKTEIIGKAIFDFSQFKIIK